MGRRWSLLDRVIIAKMAYSVSDQQYKHCAGGRIYLAQRTSLEMGVCGWTCRARPFSRSSGPGVQTTLCAVEEDVALCCEAHMPVASLPHVHNTQRRHRAAASSCVSRAVARIQPELLGDWNDRLTRFNKSEIQHSPISGLCNYCYWQVVVTAKRC